MQEIFAERGPIQTWFKSVNFSLWVKISHLQNAFRVKFLTEPIEADLFHLLGSYFMGVGKKLEQLTSGCCFNCRSLQFAIISPDYFWSLKKRGFKDERNHMHPSSQVDNADFGEFLIDLFSKFRESLIFTPASSVPKIHLVEVVVIHLFFLHIKWPLSAVPSHHLSLHLHAA